DRRLPGRGRGRTHQRRHDSLGPAALDPRNGGRVMEAAGRATAPVISVKGMSTGYAGQPVVHDLSFDVMAGEVLCLLGPNGAGKTTTMLALAGELPLIEGEVEFAGVKRNAPLYKRARNGMSYVTEE